MGRTGGKTRAKQKEDVQEIGEVSEEIVLSRYRREREVFFVQSVWGWGYRRLRFPLKKGRNCSGEGK